MARRIHVLGADGHLHRVEADAGERSLAGYHYRDIHRFLRGEIGPEAVEGWRGRRVGGVRLQGDPDELEGVVDRGELDEEDLQPYPEQGK